MGVKSPLNISPSLGYLVSRLRDFLLKLVSSVGEGGFVIKYQIAINMILVPLKDALHVQYLIELFVHLKLQKYQRRSIQYRKPLEILS